MDGAAARTPRLPQLDERLQTAYALVPHCALCADIGADHGRLIARLLADGRAERALVSDISADALDKARRRLQRLHLADRATFARADGFEALDVLPDGRADVACVLGMGGDTIARMLLAGRERLSGATLVLGAQTLLPTVRRAVADVGYALAEERLALASGRIYTLMRCVPAAPGARAPDERTLFAGLAPVGRDEPLRERWLSRRLALAQTAAKRMESADRRKDDERLALTRREIACLTEALELERKERGEGV